MLLPPFDAAALLRDLVRFPSLSHEEHEVADFVEGYVRSFGLPVERRDNNVYFWLGDGEDVLLLNSHLDVVPPSARHPYEPFTPTEVDGNLYGRGTVDAKASGAAMTTAVLTLAAQGFVPRGGKVLVALTACEETGGGYNGLEDLRPHLPAVRAALVGEPTEMQPCLAQKGLLILHVVAHGISAHAARSHLGDNALYSTARDLLRLEALRPEREHPFLGATTITPTIVRGGEVKNMVPETSSITLDIRTTPSYTHEELIDWLQEQMEGDVQVHSKRLIPTETSADERLVRACLKALPGAQPFGSPTMSDWLFLADVPTIKIGPGKSERSHTADEHIAIAEVYEAAESYAAIIKSYFTMV